jgi:hypothetical protein
VGGWEGGDWEISEGEARGPSWRGRIILDEGWGVGGWGLGRQWGRS